MAGHKLKHSFLTLDHKLFTGVGTAWDSRQEFSAYCSAENQCSREGNGELFGQRDICLSKAP